MKLKPLIGLTPQYRDYKEMDRSILGRSYTESIQNAGGLPVIIPPIINKQDLNQLLARLDGLVLTGGDDLNPEIYGEVAEPLTPRPGHPLRATHDKQIFEYIWEHKLPTLAICLGLQEVNVFLGGSLYQDIPTQIKKPLTHKIGDWFEARHPVSLISGSRLNQVTGLNEVDTNSAHHQAVRVVSDHLQVSGRSGDGVIEAIEPKDPSMPLLAVQWHPESETNDVVGIELFKWLVSKAN